MIASHGRIGTGALFFLFLVTVVIYLGFQLAPPYWEFYSLKEAARQGLVASSAPPYRDADIKDAVLGKARRLGVALVESDLTFSRTNKAVSIEFSWDREVLLPGGYVKRFSFKIEDTEPLH